MPVHRTAGLVLAATGALHFAAPQVFEPISRGPFPRHTRRWIYTNGATELALGLALANDRARRPATAGLAVYTGWLAARTVLGRRAR
jgi:uncharacterized membrane protein